MTEMNVSPNEAAPSDLDSDRSRPGAPRGRLLAGGAVVLALLLGFFALCLAGLVDFGNHRWPVKTFRDRDRSRVRLAPVDTTVAALSRLSRPADSAFRGLSRIAPAEFAVFRVRAILGRVSSEWDGDIHLVLSDPDEPSRTVIAEIPHPLFSLGSGFEDAFRAERTAIWGRPRDRELAAEVTGVGFFDYRIHRKSGGPANGFELHPVIGLRFLEGR